MREIKQESCDGGILTETIHRSDFYPSLSFIFVLKGYLLTLGLLPVIFSALCGFYFLMALEIFVASCLPDKMITANEPYIIRVPPPKIRNRGDCLVS